jgi:uncharacterized membrane protein YeaQ/YmgE (transglycosylase-associated protein family)
MSISNEDLVVVLLIGLLAGSATGNILQSRGLDLATNLAVGVVGAFFGHWLLPLIHIDIGNELISLVINAALGATIMIVAFGLAAMSPVWGGHPDRMSRGFGRLRKTQS